MSLVATTSMMQITRTCFEYDVLTKAPKRVVEDKLWMDDGEFPCSTKVRKPGKGEKRRNKKERWGSGAY